MTRSCSLCRVRIYVYSKFESNKIHFAQTESKNSAVQTLASLFDCLLTLPNIYTMFLF